MLLLNINGTRFVFCSTCSFFIFYFLKYLGTETLIGEKYIYVYISNEFLFACIKMGEL